MLPIDVQARRWRGRYGAPERRARRRPRRDRRVKRGRRPLAPPSGPHHRRPRCRRWADAGAGDRRLGELIGALLATSAVANGLFAGDPFALGISRRLASRWPRLLGAADLVVAFGAALNTWTTRHGALVADGARVVQVDRRRGGDRRAPAGRPRRRRRRRRDRRGAARARGRRGRRGRRTARSRRDRRRALARRALRDARRRLDPRTLSIALDELLPRRAHGGRRLGHFMGYPSMYLRVPDAPGSSSPRPSSASGSALGNAIGAARRAPDRLTVAALGDGGR